MYQFLSPLDFSETIRYNMTYKQCFNSFRRRPMSRKIQIKIRPDGTIEAETLGFTGKKCLDLIPLLEKLTDAKVVDSDYKQEYYEEENVLTEDDKVVNKNT